ncbi:hypothetical protein [Streptomyces sp. ISL-98]|nr:hypothetical protein [Streptomyces sp. ISL-98]
MHAGRRRRAGGDGGGGRSSWAGTGGLDLNTIGFVVVGLFFVT